MDRDAARIALIETAANAWAERPTGENEPIRTGDEWRRMIVEVVIDALLVARQDVPCETCEGTSRMSPIAGQPLKDAIGGGDGTFVRCPDCTDGSVPGPLLIDVMMGWEQVGWVDLDGSLWPLKVTPFDNSEPVYRRTPTGED